MSIRAICLGAAAAALLCGCSTTVVRDEPDNVAIAEALLAHVRGTDVQIVEGAWKDEAFTAECVIKCDGEEFTAVLLAPQMRLATLTLRRPHVLHWERVPQIPAMLDPEYVMFDLALVILPTDALSRSLDDGFKVSETADGRRRMVLDGDGELHSVRQTLPDGGVYFRNVKYGYEITVRTMSHED